MRGKTSWEKQYSLRRACRNGKWFTVTTRLCTACGTCLSGHTEDKRWSATSPFVAKRNGTRPFFFSKIKQERMFIAGKKMAQSKLISDRDLGLQRLSVTRVSSIRSLHISCSIFFFFFLVPKHTKHNFVCQDKFVR